MSGRFIFTGIKGRPGSFNKRRGFALMECIFLILVVSVVLMALLSTVAYSMRLREHGQTDIDTYLLAQSWFDALEVASPDLIISNFDGEAKKASVNLGGKVVGGHMVIRGMELSPLLDVNLQNIGVLRVNLRILKPDPPDPSGRRTELTFTRNLNLFSSETVPDNLIRRR